MASSLTTLVISTNRTVLVSLTMERGVQSGRISYLCMVLCKTSKTTSLETLLLLKEAFVGMDFGLVS